MFTLLSTIYHLYGDYLIGLAAVFMASYWPRELIGAGHQTDTDRGVDASENKNSASVAPLHSMEHYDKLKVGWVTDFIYLAR